MQLFKRKPQEAGPLQQGSVPTSVAKQPTVSRASSDAGAPRTEQKVPQGPASTERPTTSKSARVEPGRPPKTALRSPPAPSGPPSAPPRELIDGIDAEIHHKLVKELGWPARKKKHVNTALAEKMHRAGFGYKQIAKYFDVFPCTIRRRLKEAKMHK